MSLWVLGSSIAIPQCVGSAASYTDASAEFWVTNIFWINTIKKYNFKVFDFLQPTVIINITAWLFSEEKIFTIMSY